MSDKLVAALSPELSPGLLEFLDVRSLLALEIVSAAARDQLRDAVEARFKRECFSTYIYSTMATYTTMASVPESWKLLYLRFSRLQEMAWQECKSEGTSSTLRSLKTDNQEYVADLSSRYLLRSGGHYWFSVLQTPLDDISISNPLGSKEELQKHVDQLKDSDKEKALAFLRSSLSINVGKWEKLRADGISPCPRRHHSMTCLPSAMRPVSILNPPSDGADASAIVPVRRVVFFGGQSEGIPFEAFNDLHVLLIDGRRKSASAKKTLARWVRPQVSGTPPSRRCGHDATALSDRTILISGGSDGTTPLPQLQVFLLHVEDDAAFGRFRWSTPRSTSPPGGRSMHGVYRIAEDEMLVFGGRQIGKSNGLLDVHRLKLVDTGEDADHPWVARWSSEPLTGCVPASRRGHTTIAIGDKLVLIGGQDVASDELYSDVRVLDVPSLQWRRPAAKSDACPCPRRGFKTQYFGTSLVVSSGFVRNESTNRIDMQLPDSDIHVLTFR